MCIRDRYRDKIQSLELEQVVYQFIRVHLCLEMLNPNLLSFFTSPHLVAKRGPKSRVKWKVFDWKKVYVNFNTFEGYQIWIEWYFSNQSFLRWKWGSKTKIKCKVFDLNTALQRQKKVRRQSVRPPFLLHPSHFCKTDQIITHTWAQITGDIMILKRY